MKHTTVTSLIVSGMVLFAVNVFATGSESKKAAKDSEKLTRELLKFSVDDFVEREESGFGERDTLNTAGGESPESAPNEKYEPADNSSDN
ncbi:MAG TPA: hypothetical protein VNJ07_04810 [Chitinophagales bacterium]|nr:hypothetical protein [Chitinophagales bacterium]